MYRVQAQGSCGAGRNGAVINPGVYSIVDETGTNAVNFQTFTREQANEIADALKHAYERGQESMVLT